jgi:hypothetical protein
MTAERTFPSQSRVGSESSLKLGTSADNLRIFTSISICSKWIGIVWMVEVVVWFLLMFYVFSRCVIAASAMSPRKHVADFNNFLRILCRW